MKTTTEYNGWKNRATWNIALHMGNDEYWYSVARESKNYAGFMERMHASGITHTPDGFELAGKSVSRRELNECIRELHA